MSSISQVPSSLILTFASTLSQVIVNTVSPGYIFSLVSGLARAPYTGVPGNNLEGDGESLLSHDTRPGNGHEDPKQPYRW